MIQRIQSIWLLAAAVFAFAGLRFPFYTGNLTEIKDGLSTQTFVSVDGFSNLYITTLTIAIGVMASIAIFLYKNRGLQIRLSILSILLELVTMYLYYRETQTLTQGTYALSSLLQVGVLSFIFLAIKGISKDNKIIRESNSLR